MMGGREIRGWYLKRARMLGVVASRWIDGHLTVLETIFSEVKSRVRIVMGDELFSVVVDVVSELDVSLYAHHISIFVMKIR